MPKRKIEVVFAGAELAPLAKVGGLGDVMGSLPMALDKLGVRVKIFLPFYGSIDKAKYKAKLVKKNIPVEIKFGAHKFDLYKTYLPGTKIEVYLVKGRFFNSQEVYIGSKKSLKKKIGDVERFTFFSKAVVESIRVMRWKIDVMHCHDWPVCLIPTFIDEYSIKYDNFENIKSVLTIHNLAHQGKSLFDILDYAALSKELTPAVMEDYYDKDGGVINLMKIGILSSDIINTVSPNYAKEILSKEYGEGLEGYLKRRQKDLYGIINGLDLKLFDPSKDKSLKKKYDLKTLDKAKDINKQALQAELKLPVEDVPVFGLVSRLVSQKGLDVLLPALDKLLKKHDIQVVVLGTGYKEYEQGLKKLAKKYKNKMSSNISFSLPLAQRIYAGSDFFLMPSRFEPCGLGQMISMRYGTLPIVRATGGLKDTVINNRTGIVFKKYTQAEMVKSITRAIKLYNSKSKFKKMRSNVMKVDFSWDKSAKEYLKLYNKLSK